MLPIKEQMYRDFHEPDVQAYALIASDEIIQLKQQYDTALGDIGDEPEVLLLLDNYKEHFLVRMTYYSNNIEGSTLTYPETAHVISGDIIASKPAKDQWAAKGIADATIYMQRELEKGRPVDESLIKDIHERTALDIDVRLRGVYRSGKVFIRGSDTTPPDSIKIRGLMADLLYHYNNCTLNPLWRATAFHVYFESIHPFADGNGRSGRNILNYMLMQSGYPPVALRNDKEFPYLQALEDWSYRDNVLPFVEQVRRNIISELTEFISITG